LLSLAGGAFAATSDAPVADLPTQKTAPNQEIILGEEELSDVSLSTFYVFDKESAKSQLGDAGTLAVRGCAVRGCGGCGGGRVIIGCGGCGGGRVTIGCGGCGGGCCWQFGRCAVC
jgi:hypothetical protein